ncbi:FAD-binding and (Fe-S)-binding domain-containing protein, partial [Nocardia gipuzkoensis]
RPLPTFARRNLPREFRRHRRSTPAAAEPLGIVNWLADSFTTYTEPHIGMAAIELLEYAGWRVELASGGCCGRSSMSKGLLDDARDKAAGLVDSLCAETEAGSPIVGCEPSCLFMLRDEYASLLPDSESARAVAGRVKQIEELLLEAIDAGRLVLRTESPLAGRRIVFHG